MTDRETARGSLVERHARVALVAVRVGCTPGYARAGNPRAVELASQPEALASVLAEPRAAANQARPALVPFGRCIRGIGWLDGGRRLALSDFVSGCPDLCCVIRYRGSTVVVVEAREARGAAAPCEPVE